jgi:drug/metabolite transporter (DMT)-like permease
MASGLAAVLFGLLSAASWGGGDFCGGLAARRAPVLRVLPVSALGGMLPLLVLALLTGERSVAHAGPLLWGAAAGLFGTIGLGALYRGLAAGRAAVVAPTSAVVAAALPALWGAASEGLPGPLRLAGFALALAGVWLIAQTGEPTRGASGLGLALLAGCGFGGFFILIDRAGEGGTYWPLLAARCVTLAASLGGALLLRPTGSVRPALPLALLGGVLDAGGNAFFVLAGQAGRLDVAAVLSSLYPATTVLLARLVLGERIAPRQALGIAAVLGAIGLIAV